jgi:hypothetical protein
VSLNFKPVKYNISNELRSTCLYAVQYLYSTCTGIRDREKNVLLVAGDVTEFERKKENVVCLAGVICRSLENSQ